MLGKNSYKGLTKVAEADAFQVIPVLFFLVDEMLKEIVTMGFRRDRLIDYDQK